MEINEALEIWRGSSFRQVNGYLISLHTKNSLRGRVYTGRVFEPVDTKEVVRVIKEHMKPIKPDKYYRGSSRRFQKNCHLETFVSLSSHIEDAKAFSDEVLYTVTTKAGVRGIKTGVENEVVLEDGCYWEYIGMDQVIIHPPSANLNYSWCSEKKGARRKTKRKTRRR